MGISNSSEGSLFSRAVGGSLPNKLSLDQIAELLVSDGGEVDSLRLNDARARIDGYRLSGVLQVGEEKEPILVLPLGAAMTFRLTGGLGHRRHDDFYESLREGHAAPQSPRVQAPATTQQYKTIYCATSEAVRAIAERERAFGPLKRGFTAWAGLPDESLRTMDEGARLLTAAGFESVSAPLNRSETAEEGESPVKTKTLLKLLEAEGYGDKSAALSNWKRDVPWLKDARPGRGKWIPNRVLRLFVQHKVPKAHIEPEKVPANRRLRAVGE